MENLHVLYLNMYHINCLVQDCSISFVNQLDILQSCTKPSIYHLHRIKSMAIILFSLTNDEHCWEFKEISLSRWHGTVYYNILYQKTAINQSCLELFRSGFLKLIDKESASTKDDKFVELESNLTLFKPLRPVTLSHLNWSQFRQNPLREILVHNHEICHDVIPKYP